LQDTDLELDARRARAQIIEKLLGEAPAVRQAQQQVTQTQTALAAARAALKDIDHDVATLNAKITEVETRLYGGRVTNPKELRDLEQDSAGLKRHRGTLEEKQLDALIGVENAEADEQRAQTALRAAEDETAKTQGNLLEERAVLQTQIGKLEIEREAILIPIPSADRETYERLRQSKRGRAVSRLDEGVCSACGVAPSSARGQSSRQGNDLIFCGNCARILCGE
jgi:hypothetical protein